jgi:hypothetical protein
LEPPRFIIIIPSLVLQRPVVGRRANEGSKEGIRPTLWPSQRSSQA